MRCEAVEGVRWEVGSGEWSRVERKGAKELHDCGALWGGWQRAETHRENTKEHTPQKNSRHLQAQVRQQRIERQQGMQASVASVAQQSMAGTRHGQKRKEAWYTCI